MKQKKKSKLIIFSLSTLENEHYLSGSEEHST